MAGVKFGVGTFSGLSLSVIVQQITSTGALGNTWDEVNQVWSASPTDANAKIALTELTGARRGYYHGQRSALGTHTGLVNVYVIDNGSAQVAGYDTMYLASGVEQVDAETWSLIPLTALQTTVLAVKAKTDLIVSGGSTAAAVTAVQTDVSTLLTRLTSTRAGYIDNLPLLDVAVSTRSLPGSLATLNTSERTAIATQIDTSSTKLNAIWYKIPSANYLTGTSSAAGNIDIDNVVGSKSAYMANVASLATASALTTVGNNVTAILADTAELQTDWANGGRLDVILDTAAAGGGGGGGATAAEIVTAMDTTSTIATRVAAVHAKLPSKQYLTGTANSDGDIQADEATGSKSAYMADVSALATAANLTLVKAKTDLITGAPALETTAQAVKSKTDLITGAPALEVTAQLIKTKTDQISGASALEATAQAIKVKTDLITTAPATATALTSVAANVTTMMTQTTENQTEWNGGGSLHTLLTSAAAGGASQVFALKTPPRDCTWKVRSGGNGSTAQNIITVGAGSTTLVAMDFTGLLPLDAGLLSADAAVDQLLPGAITIASLAKSQDVDSAVFTVSGLTAGNKHRIKVTVTATDGQILVGYGNLEVQ